MLRSELAAANGRGGVAQDAYALLLAGRAPELLESLGGTADAEELKRMVALLGQRVLRAGRTPDVATAALLAEAALAHADNPVLARLGERPSAQMAAAQRPDGTCQGADGWTLPRPPRSRCWRCWRTRRRRWRTWAPCCSRTTGPSVAGETAAPTSWA